MTQPVPAAEPAAAGPQPAAMVAVTGVSRSFGRGEAAVQALQGVTFSVPKGSLTVVYGRSGSGKTTLLNIIGGLDTPSSGTVHIAGREVTGMPERQRTLLRRTVVAFVFQSFGLIPILSAAENVAVPLRIVAADRRLRDERVRQLLSIVGLEDRAQHRPDELSGGQQQRVAIARALAGSPQLLIADEPTGQLDSESGRQIARLIQAVVRSEGLTAIIATHDPELLGMADSVVRLTDGRLTG